jgi:hypothetical protein
MAQKVENLKGSITNKECQNILKGLLLKNKRENSSYHAQIVSVESFSIYTESRIFFFINYV